MQLRIQVKGLTKAKQLRRFAVRKFEVALSRFSHSIQEASVRLDDINGPERGGVDKLCRVVLRFKDNSVVVIEELGAEVFRVIDRVADRLHQNVSRQIAYAAKIDRQGMRHQLLPASI